MKLDYNGMSVIRVFCKVTIFKKKQSVIGSLQILIYREFTVKY